MHFCTATLPEVSGRYIGALVVYIFYIELNALARYAVFHKKNRTPKAGRHKFIKISSYKMIFHTVHCHSVADSLYLKSLVWAEYQLHFFHGNKSRLVKVWELGADDCGPGHWPVEETTHSLRQGQRTTFWTFTITLVVRLDCLYQHFSILKPFSWSYNKKFQGSIFYETQCTIIGQIVTYCISGGTCIVGESFQCWRFFCWKLFASLPATEFVTCCCCQRCLH